MKFPSSPASLLQELIRIPSVNPDSAAGDESTAGEAACAQRVGEYLEYLGAEVKFEEILPGRPNVIGHFPSESDEAGLLFAPHLDTVSAQGMTIPPFDGVVSDGRIWGRGASDTKGTMAAMLWAFHEMRDTLPRLPIRVSFVGLMGEEASQPGSQHFATHHKGEFSFAVIGEPTQLQIVHAHKGYAWHKLSASGLSCHGSTPNLGENAIEKLLPILQALMGELREKLPHYSDPVLGSPTVNLGQIRGGSSLNIVPSHCEALLDIRETPALYEAGGSRRLIADFISASGWADQLEIETIGSGAPMLTPPKTDGVQRLLSLGLSLASAPWYCDAGRLSKGDIPAVACGPGSIAQAHTKDEFLSVDDLEAGCVFYRRFLESYTSR